MHNIKTYHISYLSKFIIIYALLQLFLIPKFSEPIYASVPTDSDITSDSLKLKLENEKIDSLKVQILNDLAWHLAPSEMDNSIFYADSAIKLAEKYNLKKAAAAALNSKGEAQRNKGLFEQSLESHKSAYKILTELNDPIGMAKTESNIGIAYFNLSEFSNAFKHFDNCLDIYELFDDKDGILNSNSYIGVVFNSFGQHEKAIEYFNKALKIAKELNNESKIGTQYNNLGLSYADLKQHSKSIEYYKKAVDQFKKNGDNFNYSIAVGNLGIPQTELKLYFEARNSFNESLEYAENLGDRYGVAHQYGNLGELYLKMEKDSIFKRMNNQNIDFKGSAIKNLNKSIAEFENIGAIEDQKDYLIILSEVYSLANNHKKAFSAFKDAIALKDSIQTRENQKVIAELEIKQELDNKESEIRILNQDKEYEAMIKTAISILAILILFIAGMIFYFFKKKQNDNILLQKNIDRREEVENSLRLNEAELTKHKNHLEDISE